LSGNVEKISFCPEIGIYKKGFNSYFFCKTEGLRGKDGGLRMKGDGGWGGGSLSKVNPEGAGNFYFHLVGLNNVAYRNSANKVACKYPILLGL
jgi:hypothetical protein